MAAKVVVYEPRLTPVELKVAWATCLSLGRVQQEHKQHVCAPAFAQTQRAAACTTRRARGNVTMAAALQSDG